MDHHETRERMREFILTRFLFTSDGSALLDDTSFLRSGIVDSTGILEILAFLEEELGVTVLDDEVIPENLDSVDRLCAFLSRKRAVAGPAAESARRT